MSDDRRHWLLRDPELLAEVKRLAAEYVPEFRDGEILAHNHDPIVDQGIFAFGDPGTETGHTLDTSSVDRTTTVDGEGNYAFFLRINLNQTRTTQDQNLTRTYKLQYDKDGAGSWTDVTGSSSNVQVVADSNITDGAATSERIGGTGAAFLAGEYDEGDGVLDSITWSTGDTEYTEMLWSLQVIDADMAAGATLDFRVIESDNTALNNTGSEDLPRLTWNAPAGATVHEHVANADGVSTAAVSLAVKRSGSALANGVAAVVVAISSILGLSARADALSTVDTGQLYRVRAVPASGTLGGTSTASVSLSALRSLTATADGVSSTAVSMSVVRGLSTQADGVSTTAVDLTVVSPSGTVYELTASPDGVASTSVAMGVRRGVSATADGVGVATADPLNVVHGLSTQADGQSTATVSVSVAGAVTLAATADGVGTAVADMGVLVTLSAQADGVSTVDTGQLYRRREIASSGTLGGTGTATVSITVVGVTVYELSATADGVSTATAALEGTELTAQADGVGTASATLYKVTQVDGGEAAGVSTATVSVTVVSGSGTVYELVAAPDGVGTATVSVFRQAHRDTQADGVSTVAVAMSVVRALSTQADGVASTTANVSGVTVVEFVANADGVSTVAALVAPIRIRSAQSDGVSTATVSVLRQAHRDTQADGTATATADIQHVYAFSVSADATASVSLALTVTLGDQAAAGKYAPEHARAYARIAAVEDGTFKDAHERASSRIDKAGV